VILVALLGTVTCQECSFPEIIFGGFRYMEGEHDGEKYASYMCFPPFVMTPNKEAFMGHMAANSVSAKEAYMDLAYIAICFEGMAIVPECKEPQKAGHCGIPNWIEHGKAVEFSMKEEKQYMGKADMTMADLMNSERIESEEIDEDEKNWRAIMPNGARYECDEDYMMHETVHKDWGWCRPDGSYESPRCEHKDTFFHLEFKLNNGLEKKLVDKDTGKAFAGIVEVRKMGPTGKPMGDWEYACNDGFNDNAAGAICRTLGFKHGAEASLTKKMQPSSDDEKKFAFAFAGKMDMDFGWTHFGCEHDDTLPQSMHCMAVRYEDAMDMMGMKAACFDFDRMAVKCFDHKMFDVDVSLEITKRKLVCQAKAEKESYLMTIGKFPEIKVKWTLDDNEIELDYKYSKRKGFTARAKDVERMEFDCMSCEVYLGDVMLGGDKHCKSGDD